MSSAALGSSLLASSTCEFVLVDDVTGVMAIIMAIPAVVLYAASRPRIGRVFKVVPGLVFCYFVPTMLSTPWTFGAETVRIIPNASPVYDFVKGPVLLASLFLLTLNLDLRGIARLGPKAVGMLLAGSLGVVIGGPIAVWLWQAYLPAEGHMPLAYLAGSWIGGGPNAVALQRSFSVSDAAISPIIVVDAFISNLWLAVLLFFAARSKAIDRRLNADTSAIDALTRRMEAYHDAISRHPSIGDIVAILALGFGASWISSVLVGWLTTPEVTAASTIGAHSPSGFLSLLNEYISPTAWKVLAVTILGILASFTRLRSLEGAGASRFGGVMIYLLVACIGAGADFSRLTDAPGYLLIAATWMLIHIIVLLTAAWLMRAPLFFVATGSQANIGGPASAPIVAGAFNPVLAPVGALLAIAGYALGTLGGLVCIHMMNLVLTGSPAVRP